MKISFTQNYKSISPFEWDDIASLSIVTGLNGAGKSQLLEVISQRYNDAFNNKRNGQSEDQSFLDHNFKFNRFSQGANGFSNISLDNQKFTYGDLKLIVETIYNYKHPRINNSNNYNGSFSYEQEQQLNTLLEARNSTNRFYHLAKSKAPAIWDFLCSTLNKDENDITPFDISLNLPDHIIFEDYYMSNGATLSFTFFLFEYKRLARINAGLPDEQDIAPWEILNEAIEASRLPYKISAPNSEDIARVFQSGINESLNIPFSITITHTSKQYNLQFYDLSSGERILMSLAMLLYYAKENGVDQDILLLDEPDAHLHPSMTKQFFNVVYDVLVKKHGVKVIMTTHSPSTVALAPEADDCSIYELRKDPTLLSKVNSREEAINSLTEGMVLVMPSTRTVLIEGKDDKPFYQALYRLLNDNKLLNGYATITFVSGTGVNSVNHWSKGLRESGLSETIRGIIDKDNGNNTSDGIFRLDRYSIENYMLDPILIFATGKIIPNNVPKYDISSGEEEKIRNLSQVQIQNISNSILAHVKPKIKNIKQNEEDIIPVTYTNGYTIDYPRWFIERRGKELFGIFNEEYGRNLTREGLTNSLKRIQLIPNDILDLFREVQV
ncbi:ATP-binding protein [Hymenobacter sp. UYP22]|uniref:AAA family ATPase n=1 Tax=Hymenobacter sp. UYP22 TaxID=3156348 RepID=UPI003390EA85